MLLILGVRLYYYSGPIFANTQDEGIYLNMYASALIFGNPVGFSQYRGIDLSNFSQCLCNPADIFQFYTGFIYPEMLLLKIFGFSVNLAIYYVILASIIEGLFIFLIIERISSIRPAVLGTVLFAFLPIDVLFSTHVQPLVPAMMFVTISTYAFIIASEGNNKAYYLYSGIFAGLAYITNPLGALLLVFLFLICIIRVLKKIKRQDAWGNTKNLLFLIAGFLAAYSLVGVAYLAETGNFFLYPSVNHAVYLLQEATQPQLTYCISHSLCLDYDVGYPSLYLSMLGNLPITTIDPYLRYFAISAYLLIPLAILGVVSKKRNRWMLPFILMFIFYLLAIMFFPANLSIKNGVATYYPIDEQPYIATILTLPLIVITALGMEALLKNKRTMLALIVIAVISAAIAYDITSLNGDVGYYVASMYTMHSFINYVSVHPNGQYYANFLFSGEANLVSGYKYNIHSLGNCSSEYLKSLSNNTYVVTGGTVSLDISPQYVQGFDNCVIPNLTGYSLVTTANNPLANYSDMYAPQLDIFKKGV